MTFIWPTESVLVHFPLHFQTVKVNRKSFQAEQSLVRWLCWEDSWFPEISGMDVGQGWDGVRGPKISLRIVCNIISVISARDSSIAHWVEMCCLACSLYNPFPFPTESFIR